MEVCGRLSKNEKYKYEEMMKELGYGEIEEEYKGEIEEEYKGVMLPWCGKVIEGNCECLKQNSGLYTQCRKKKEVGSEVCKSCKVSMERNGGVCIYGTVRDRLECGLMDYKDSRGKKCVAYGKVMKKMNISREEAERSAKLLGWEIADVQFESSNMKRGRPRKEGGKEVSVVKKSRGRPRKSKEVVSSNVGEELIASLMKECENEECEKEECEKEECENEECENEECEETCVERFEYDGVTYLKSEENMLFDINSHEALGVWNEMDGKIEELNDE